MLVRLAIRYLYRSLPKGCYLAQITELLGLHLGSSTHIPKRWKKHFWPVNKVPSTRSLVKIYNISVWWVRVLRTFSGFKFYYSSVLNGENPYKMIALCLCEGLILGILMKHILCNIIWQNRHHQSWTVLTILLYHQFRGLEQGRLAEWRRLNFLKYQPKRKKIFSDR